MAAQAVNATDGGHKSAGKENTMYSDILRELRGTKSQEKVAHDLNISASAYQKYELGERLKDYFGILPADATIGKDPDERD